MSLENGINLFLEEMTIGMCKQCKADCVFFPYVDKEYEYTINKKGIKHRVDSQEYNCVFLNKKIRMGEDCFKYTNKEDIKEYRRKLVEI